MKEKQRIYSRIILPIFAFGLLANFAFLAPVGTASASSSADLNSANSIAAMPQLSGFVSKNVAVLASNADTCTSDKNLSVITNPNIQPAENLLQESLPIQNAYDLNAQLSSGCASVSLGSIASQQSLSVAAASNSAQITGNPNQISSFSYQSGSADKQLALLMPAAVSGSTKRLAIPLALLLFELGIVAASIKSIKTIAQLQVWRC